MKKIILFALLSLAYQLSKSQVYIKHKNLNADSTIRYWEIKISADHESVSIYSVDYGQRQPLLFGDYIADASGKKVKFHSPMELLHYVTNNGWKLVQRDLVPNPHGPYAFLLFERL